MICSILDGMQVGFLYQSVLEDYLTGFTMHCGGWTSVYCNPSRPQFLGSGVTNMNDMLVQATRWSSGLFDVAISKYSPLIYGPLRMSILESICYAHLAYLPLYFIPVWCFGLIPQLCLLNGIPLYPKVTKYACFSICIFVSIYIFFPNLSIVMFLVF